MGFAVALGLADGLAVGCCAGGFALGLALGLAVGCGGTEGWGGGAGAVGAAVGWSEGSAEADALGFAEALADADADALADADGRITLILLPFDTVKTTVAPGSTTSPARGDWRRTVSSFSLESIAFTETFKPRASRSFLASSTLRPVTIGTSIWPLVASLSLP